MNPRLFILFALIHGRLLGPVSAATTESEALNQLENMGAEYTQNTRGLVESIHLEERPVGDEEMKLIANFPSLRRLYLAGTRVSDAGLAHLAGLKHLERLSLWETRISDAGLTVVGRFSHLRVLDIHSTSISDAGLAHLSGLRELERLNLRGTKVTGTGTKHLQSLEWLKDLDLSEAPLTQAGTEQVLSLVRRTRLNLRDTPIRLGWISDSYAEGVIGLVLNQQTREPWHRTTDHQLELTKIRGDDLSHLKRFNQGKPLRWLYLSGDSVNNESLSDLNQLTGLETAVLRGTRIGDATASQLAASPRLKKIDLGGTRVTDNVFESLAKLPQLEELAIDATKIRGDDRLGLLSRLEKLRRLTVGGENFPAKRFNALPKSSPLVQLTIRDPQFSPEELSGLSKRDGFHHLALVGPQVKDNWLPALEKFRGIEQLDLHETSVSDRALILLKKINSLRMIRLPGMDVNSGRLRTGPAVDITFHQSWHGEGANGLTAYQRFSLHNADDVSLTAFKNLPETRLLLIQGHITSAGFAELGGLKQLERISVRSPHLDDRVVPHLKKLTNLRSVYLFETQVGGAALELLKHLPKLTYLTTPSHHVEIETAEQFGGVKATVAIDDCHALREGELEPVTHIPNLRVVHFRQYCETATADLGLKSLAKIEGLKQLELFRWQLTDEGAAEFDRMKSLEALSCSEVNLDGKALTHLAKLPKLREIIAPGSDVRDTGLSPLADATALEVIVGFKVGPRGTVGLKNLKRLRILKIPGSDLIDEGLENLTALNHLEELDISGSQVTDEGLARLSPIRSLKTLNLGELPLKGPGLSHLEDLKNLEELVLPEGIAGNSLSHLAGLNLKRLELYGPLTEEGIQQITKLKNLETLTVRGEVAQQGIENLSKLDKLHELSFWSDVSDEQMQQLAKVTSLRDLFLSGSGQHDSGPKALATLPHLKKLHLGFMELSNEAWGSLKGIDVMTYD